MPSVEGSEGKDRIFGGFAAECEIESGTLFRSQSFGRPLDAAGETGKGTDEFEGRLDSSQRERLEAKIIKQKKKLKKKDEQIELLWGQVRFFQRECEEGRSGRGPGESSTAAETMKHSHAVGELAAQREAL